MQVLLEVGTLFKCGIAIQFENVLLFYSLTFYYSVYLNFIMSALICIFTRVSSKKMNIEYKLYYLYFIFYLYSEKWLFLVSTHTSSVQNDKISMTRVYNLCSKASPHL